MAALDRAQRREFRALIRRVERLRKELGWSQERIAQLCGIQQATYSRWVQGKSEPTPLAYEGLKSRVPSLIAELQANRQRIEQILRELEELRGGV
jgi:transcriptional regulator with XRE-family HTH domain